MSVQEATAAALEALGAHEGEVDIEVLNEGRRGIFGGGRKAQVRVTLREAAPRDVEAPPEAVVEEDSVSNQEEQVDTVRDPAAQERDESAETDAVEDEAAGDAAAEPMTEAPARSSEPAEAPEEPSQEVDFEDLPPQARMDLLDQEAELAADFVEGLLDRLDLPGDIEIEVHEEQAVVNILDVGSGLLIGRRGATLDALQEVVRGAVQRQTERRPHVRVDVEGYRSRQLEKLRDRCREAIAEVRETGKPVRLEPMDPYERKMMHDLVAKTRGVTSSSEGTEPKRRVVVHPEE